MTIDINAVASVLGITTEFVNLKGGITLLPQRLAVVGQGITGGGYSTDKRQVTSAAEAGQTYGFGSPIHLAILQLLPDNGDGVGTIPVTVYPLNDDGAGVVSTGDITPSGAASATISAKVRVNNIDSEEFVITNGDTVATIVTAMTAAINAVLEMPIIAVDGVTKVNFTSKWKGTSANDIFVEVVESADPGITFAITQPVGGLVNPDVQDALDQVGNVWETMLLNCMEIADVDSLDIYDTFGEGRWGELVRKPLVVFTGDTNTTVAAATAVSDARKTDRTNSQLVAPGSDNLPFVVAARQLARIVVVANNNPPVGYGSQAATGLIPGLDGEQWTFIERDEAIKKGSSGIVVKDGVIHIADVVTFYHPTGEPIPAYRQVVNIVKLQNILFNLDLIFAQPEWDGAPLLPDNQPTTNRAARKPKDAKAAMASMVDSLGLEAILSDPETAKASLQASINAGNPDRLDASLTVQVSGNTNIKGVTLKWGFFFGTPAVIA